MPLPDFIPAKAPPVVIHPGTYNQEYKQEYNQPIIMNCHPSPGAFDMLFTPNQLVNHHRAADLERNNYMLYQGTNGGQVWSDTNSGKASEMNSGGFW